MKRENDFAAAIVRELENEAGAHCSAPFCRRATSGPSDARSSRKTQVGQAAHIVAASKDAARGRDPLPDAERKMAKNGIWLCNLHAKMIDDDEQRYTVEILRAWKRQAARLARQRVETSQPLQQRELIGFERLIQASPDINRSWRNVVFEFLQDIGLAAVWGDDLAESMRIMLTELGFNAAKHGKATHLLLRSHAQTLVLVEDSRTEFGRRDLLASSSGGGGGRDTLEAIERLHGDSLVATYRRTRSGRSKWIFADIHRAPRKYNPCIVTPADLDPRKWPQTELKIASCGEVHVYLPSHWTRSDRRDIAELLIPLDDRPLVLHNLPGGSMALDFVRAAFPQARVAGTERPSA